MIRLNKEQKKRAGHLQRLANKYGDFKIAKAWRDEQNNEQKWTKHHSVLACWESDEGIAFLAEANNREPVINEIILDFDNGEKEEEIVNGACKWLEEMECQYQLYFSGSRGFHIHLKIPKWVINDKFTDEDRWNARAVISSILNRKFGTDPLKKNRHSMIAIENVPHWKTGKKKTLIKSTWDGLDDEV